MMRNVYGSALPARMALEKQILGRYCAYDANVQRHMWLCYGAHHAQVCLQSTKATWDRVFKTRTGLSQWQA